LYRRMLQRRSGRTGATARGPPAIPVRGRANCATCGSRWPNRGYGSTAAIWPFRGTTRSTSHCRSRPGGKASRPRSMGTPTRQPPPRPAKGCSKQSCCAHQGGRQKESARLLLSRYLRSGRNTILAAATAGDSTESPERKREQKKRWFGNGQNGGPDARDASAWSSFGTDSIAADTRAMQE
jgi:hypothetical protein